MTDADAFGDAIFISSLSPGYIAGGAQCTLAFLAAVSEIHDGRVTYVGPPFLEPKPDIRLCSTVWAQPRSWVAKGWALAVAGYADRTTPVAVEYLKKNRGWDGTVYVNGDAAGGVVEVAKRGSAKVVFMPQNFAPEYLAVESRGFGGWLRSVVGSRVALSGYRNADLRLCLTSEDQMAYDRATGIRGGSASGMYFGYPGMVATRVAVPDVFTVLVNANLATRQNEDGVLWFLDEVWSALPERDRWRLVLAGRYPTPAILGRVSRMPSVEVVERPEPDEMEKVFQRASVCLAPTRAGSGIKLKVAESLRRGIPVVSSDHCARGYDVVSREVLCVYRTSRECGEVLQRLARTDLGALVGVCTEEYDRHLSFSSGVKRMRVAMGALRG